MKNCIRILAMMLVIAMLIPASALADNEILTTKDKAYIF